MKKARVGIIGCGRISVMHLVSLAQIEECELVCCCDIKEDRANKVASQYHVKAYTNYEEMIQKEQLDAVHICLPHYLHFPAAMYAMEHGVNVLTEKPMTIDFDSAQRAVNYAKEKNLLYGVIFQTRFNNSARLVKKEISSGHLGKIICARSILTWSRPDSYYQESDWKGTWNKEGGGVIIDQAIHSIDLVNWIMDSEPVSVSCSLANRGHKIVKVEDTAEGLITYKNGAKYGFYCMNNYANDDPIEIEFICEKGRAVFGYDDAYIYFNDGRKLEAHQDTNLLDYEDAKEYWGFQHIREIKQFYQSLLHGQPLEVSGEECLKTHALICKIYQEGLKGFMK